MGTNDCSSRVYFFLSFVQSDRTYSFVTTSPPTSYYLKAAAGIEKGAAKPGVHSIQPHSQAYGGGGGGGDEDMGVKVYRGKLSL